MSVMNPYEFLVEKTDDPLVLRMIVFELDTYADGWGENEKTYRTVTDIFEFNQDQASWVLKQAEGFTEINEDCSLHAAHKNVNLGKAKTLRGKLKKVIAELS